MRGEGKDIPTCSAPDYKKGAPEGAPFFAADRPARRSPPQLSIIVPVLNESDSLPELFASLNAQTGVDFEVIVCDGGSRDGSAELTRSLARSAPFVCTVLQSERGRARQMNAAADAAHGETLLFLHADCLFDDPTALRKGLDALEAAVLRRCDDRAAVRFALRFRRSEQTPSLPYYISEAKARLNRPGCIHGDQGLLLRRSFFRTVGPFDERLPFMEDARISEAVFRQGEWVLAQAQIETSARRFEIEGLAQRHTLNALAMNFFHIGCSDLLRALPDIYRTQDRSARLELSPFFNEIRRYLKGLSPGRRFVLWYRTGAYVRDNAWQLPFAWDQRRHFRKRRAPGAAENLWLQRFERYVEPLIDNVAGRLLSALVVRLWFEGVCRRRR